MPSTILADKIMIILLTFMMVMFTNTEIAQNPTALNIIPSVPREKIRSHTQQTQDVARDVAAANEIKQLLQRKKIVPSFFTANEISNNDKTPSPMTLEEVVKKVLRNPKRTSNTNPTITFVTIGKSDDRLRQGIPGFLPDRHQTSPLPDDYGTNDIYYNIEVTQVPETRVGDVLVYPNVLDVLYPQDSESSVYRIISPGELQDLLQRQEEREGSPLAVSYFVIPLPYLGSTST